MRNFLILFLLALPLHAQAGDASKCLEIEDHADRLYCYDLAHGEKPPFSKIDRWLIVESVSEITDLPGILLSLQSDQKVQLSLRDELHLSLIVACANNNTSLFFQAEPHLFSNARDYRNVTLRIDSEKASTFTMLTSENGDSLGLWRGQEAIPLIKSMLGRQKLLARFTAIGEAPFIVSFTLNGLDSAIESVRKHCGW